MAIFENCVRRCALDVPADTGGQGARKKRDFFGNILDIEFHCELNQHCELYHHNPSTSTVHSHYYCMMILTTTA